MEFGFYCLTNGRHSSQDTASTNSMETMKAGVERLVVVNDVNAEEIDWHINETSFDIVAEEL